MDARRAQDMLRHITQDSDFGVSMLEKITVGESIYILNRMLPECIKKAEAENKENDIGYFGGIISKYRPIILEKIKTAPRLWVVYSDLTGYPYMLDLSLIHI